MLCWCFGSCALPGGLQYCHLYKHAHSVLAPSSAAMHTQLCQGLLMHSAGLWPAVGHCPPLFRMYGVGCHVVRLCLCGGVDWPVASCQLGLKHRMRVSDASVLHTWRLLQRVKGLKSKASRCNNLLGPGCSVMDAAVTHELFNSLQQQPFCAHNTPPRGSPQRKHHSVRNKYARRILGTSCCSSIGLQQPAPSLLF